MKNEIACPMVSVIIPVYNTEAYLKECIESFLNQTFQDFELICVDDGSTDSSMDILRHYAEADSRIHLFSLEHKGAGAARNYGYLQTKGRYVYFFDSDDFCTTKLLELTVEAAEREKADIVAFNYYRLFADGSQITSKGIHQDWLSEELTAFNYENCPDLIMSIINPTPWNKLFSSEFIRNNQLKYEEISSSNDITFAAVSAASAKQIAIVAEPLMYYRFGHEGTITSTKYKNLNNIIIAVSSAVRQAQALPYSDQIKNSIYRFAVDNYIFGIKNNIVDFEDQRAKDFYQYIHELFNTSEYEGIAAEQLHNDKLYRDFCTVKKHDYVTMQRLLAKKIIVSLTSHPARIKSVHQVLETIYAQTKKADKVILWLAEEQFSHKEQDLPLELLELIQNGRLTLRWCDDLKPHKKYFYALQEYPEDLVITIDDDMLYPVRLIDRLFKSYLMYPNAVSTARAHLMVVSEEKKLLPYKDWIRETDACLYEPSMQLLATGCSGVLYPAELFRKDMFNKDAIMRTCLWADDLWLKAMELVSDVPVVVAHPLEPLKYVKGTQESALWRQNLDQNQNDTQLSNIMEWLDAYVEPGIFMKKLTATDIGVSLLGIEALCRAFACERNVAGRQKRELQRKLQQTYTEKSAINAKLQRTYAEKSEINAKLQRTYAEKSEINRKLQITYREKAERGVEIKRLKEELKVLQKKTTTAAQEQKISFMTKVRNKIKHYLVRSIRKLRRLF